MKIAKSVNRLGTEAVYNIFVKTKKLAKKGKEIIDLSLGQSNFASPEHVVEATIKALKDGRHGYTLPNGINTCVGELGSRISGGQLQRIGIARALYNKPQIIVFDEATNSLDPENEDKIINLIKSYTDITIIFISHNRELLKESNKVLNL